VELRKRAASLPDDYLVVLVGDMITEEALPTYMAMLNTLDGVRDQTGAEQTPWGRCDSCWRCAASCPRSRVVRLLCSSCCLWDGGWRTLSRSCRALHAPICMAALAFFVPFIVDVCTAVLRVHLYCFEMVSVQYGSVGFLVCYFRGPGDCAGSRCWLLAGYVLSLVWNASDAMLCSHVRLTSV